MIRVPPHPDWHRHAACRGVDPAVFVDGRPLGQFAAAKRFCQDCPVVDTCLTHAMDNPQELGVWGGLTARERNNRRLRTRRAS